MFYSQFEELEVFSRFGSRLDERTRKTLARGRAVREALKQPQYDPLSAMEQVAILLAATEGLFDNVPPDRIAEASSRLRRILPERLPLLCKSVDEAQKLTADDREAIVNLAKGAIGAVWTPPSQ